MNYSENKYLLSIHLFKIMKTIFTSLFWATLLISVVFWHAWYTKEWNCHLQAGEHCHTEWELTPAWNKIYQSEETCYSYYLPYEEWKPYPEQVEVCWNYNRTLIENPDYISPEEQRIIDLENQVQQLQENNQQIANTLLWEEAIVEPSIFEWIEFDNICTYRPLDTILRIYEQHQDCEVFTYSEEDQIDEAVEYKEWNTCRAYEQCLMIESDIEAYPNNAIIEWFKLYQYCENHTTPIRNARCNMLRPTVVEPLPVATTQATISESINTSTMIQNNTQITTTSYILDQETKSKIEKVKLLLDAKWHSKNTVVALVQNIKNNLEIWSKKYAIADYLISLY